MERALHSRCRVNLFTGFTNPPVPWIATLFQSNRNTLIPLTNKEAHAYISLSQIDFIGKKGEKK